MKEYELELREVIYTPTELYVDWKVLESTIIKSNESFNITLPDRGEPYMLAIYVWALDKTQESSNYKIGRRFALFDNSSIIDLSENNPIIPVSADPDTGYQWQISLSPVVLYWTNHFYNNKHIVKNLLLPIRRETNQSQPIEGIFEQNTGDLPVSGTPNVDGIVNFMYRVIKVFGNSTTEIENGFVPDPLSQSIVLKTPISDGDTLLVYIEAIDIMNNTMEDNITLYIDSSDPEIINMQLMKDGIDNILVHNTTDLSAMEITFEAFDWQR